MMNVLLILASLSALAVVLGGPIVSDNCNDKGVVIIMLLSTEYYIPIMW